MATAGNTQVPNPNEKLVKVFDSEQETEVLVVRGLLEAAGIEAITRNLDLPQDVIPVGGVEILVRAEQADEARAMIEEYRTNGEQAAEEAEAESETGTADEPHT